MSVALRRLLPGVLACIWVSLLAGCSPAQPRASATRATTTSTQASTTTTPSLQSVAWGNVTVPPEVCPGLSQPVKLTAKTGSSGTSGSATIPAPPGHQFGTPDDFIQEYQTVFGTLGPGQNVAGLLVWCSNTGGTSDGDIENSLVLYSWVSGQLTVLSTLNPPQLSHNQIRAPYFDGSAGGVTISNGSISTREMFSGPQDAVCCPSGRATTVWTFSGHSFSPRTTVQSQPVGG
jgi:hypothetical protein